MKIETTNNTDEIWENLNKGNYQIALGYIRWLILITFIIIKKATELSDFLTNRCVKSLKYVFQLILTALNYLDNCNSLIIDDIDENIPLITFKENVKSEKDAKIEPIKMKEEKGKEQKFIENKHPWDIAQEIITEQNQAALAIKWSAIPHETLFDEHFLRVLHAIEELTDLAPLKDAMTQLPKNIYEIVKQYEHIPNVTVKLTDELIYNISKSYFYSVIESLSKLIRSIQQGQRTYLVSMARVINEQKEIIKEYQGLTELPNQIKREQGQLQKQIDRVKEQTAAQLERVDKRAIATFSIISDIRSHIKKIEDTLENTGILVEQSEQLEWEFPEDIVELHAADESEFFHTDDEVPPLESEETNVSSTTKHSKSGGG